MVVVIQIFDQIFFEDGQAINNENGHVTGRIVIDKNLDSGMGEEVEDGRSCRSPQVFGEEAIKETNH